MSSADKYVPHYSIDDHRQWEGDWELLEGVPIAMTPSPFGPHQRLAQKLAFELETAVRADGCDAVVMHEIDWVVSDDTVVRPDVVLLCGGVPQEHIVSAPALIVEVLSRSTRERDLSVKKALYLREGVPNYLIADPDRKTLELFHSLNKTEYAPLAIETSMRLSVCETCDLQVDLSDIFASP